MGKRALIAGGSLAGLTAGILLRRQGWHVDIFERVAEDLADRGGGIATQDEMWEVLADAGLDVAHRPGVRLHRRAVFAADGSIVEERPIDEIVTAWDTLYRLLMAAFPADLYHRGRTVSAVDQTEDGVALTFDDGGRARGDLVVAADGAGSTIRGQFCPDVKPEYANYIAWRGLVTEGDLPPLVRRELVDAFSFCLPPGEQMLSYTVPGPRGEEAPGQRRHNFVWYQPAEPEHVLPDLVTDAEGKLHHPNIPPPKIRAEVVERMRAHADAVLSPAYAALVRATEQPFIQPIADQCAPRLAFGRVALIGDGAALARPHVGAGTSKAMSDAHALAEALGDGTDIDAAIQRYESERLPVARRMVEHGRWLGRGLDPANAPGGDDQAPETLLTKTARGRPDR